jgi:multicomponent Na+:H+ antiporter subunit E
LENRLVLAMFLRVVGFCGLWWLLSDGSFSSWIIGAPTVAGAAYASMLLQSETPSRFHLLSVVQFLGVFLWDAVRGGVIVAVRAFHPHLPLAPLFVEYPLQLPESSARLLFANTVSLLPGTLSARFHDNHLTIHALAGDPQDISAELRSLEQLIANVYGITLLPPESPKEGTRV